MRCSTTFPAIWPLVLACWLVIGDGTAQWKPPETRKPASSAAQRKRDAKLSKAARWFASGDIVELRFELSIDNEKRLRRSPRRYVQARMREGKQAAVDVGLKLKGSAGSFRDLQDKPGLTIDVNRYDRKGAFHGLVKFHLNNAVQDPSYLREDLAYEICRRAGLPAPRVTHARVWLGERDLGLCMC